MYVPVPVCNSCSLAVLKMVKCCIAAGCSGSYSDDLFRFPRNDSNGPASLANYGDGILSSTSQALQRKLF